MFPDFTRTRTSILSSLLSNNQRILAITILWHPNFERIGEQVLGPHESGEIRINRFEPCFGRIGSLNQVGLLESVLSRSHIEIRRSSTDCIEINPPNSRMLIEVNGKAIVSEETYTEEQVSDGIVMILGGQVALCLHWVTSIPRDNVLGGLIGVSSGMYQVREKILQAAKHGMPVMLHAKTGCGKELAARAIHELSERAVHPMVTINMATVSDETAVAELFGSKRGAYTGATHERQGYFAEAGKGTLFLDEIGNATPQVQAMLLRVLENDEYRPLGSTGTSKNQARLIAATDQNLSDGRFNAALAQRLESFPIHIPELKQRREDIGILIYSMLQESKIETAASLPMALLSHLFLFDYPGNVRQLKQFVKRAELCIKGGFFDDLILLGNEINSLMQSDSSPEDTPTLETKVKKEIDGGTVLKILLQEDWSISSSARKLNISRPTLYSLIKKYNLNR